MPTPPVCHSREHSVTRVASRRLGGRPRLEICPPPRPAAPPSKEMILDQTRALRAMTSEYQRALSLGVRFWVWKSQ